MIEEEIGTRAGSRRFGIIHAGVSTRPPGELIKERVRKGMIRLLIGTDELSS
jgi:hypothetical protein